MILLDYITPIFYRTGVGAHYPNFYQLQIVRRNQTIKAVSDDTIFACDCSRLHQTRFQSCRVRGTIASCETNLRQLGRIGANRVKKSTRCKSQKSGAKIVSSETALSWRTQSNFSFRFFVYKKKNRVMWAGHNAVLLTSSCWANSVRQWVSELLVSLADVTTCESFWRNCKALTEKQKINEYYYQSLASTLYILKIPANIKM